MKSASPQFKKNVIYLGDCGRMMALPDNAIDLVVAGPPYWNLIDYESFGRVPGSKRQWHDGVTYEAFLEQLALWFTEVFRVLKQGRFCVVNLGVVRHDGDVKPLPFHAVALLERIGFTFCYEIVWHKPAGGRRLARAFLRRPFAGTFVPNNVVEYLLVFRKEPNVRFATRREVLAHVENTLVVDEVFRREVANNVWHIMPASGDLGHPCPFPPEIPLRLISLLSLRGDTVLDPFMGSGTTARAAKMLGRRFVGYEKVPQYRQLALRLLKQPLRVARPLMLALESKDG